MINCPTCWCFFHHTPLSRHLSACSLSVPQLCKAYESSFSTWLSSLSCNPFAVSYCGCSGEVRWPNCWSCYITLSLLIANMNSWSQFPYKFFMLRSSGSLSIGAYTRGIQYIALQQILNFIKSSFTTPNIFNFYWILCQLPHLASQTYYCT